MFKLILILMLNQQRFSKKLLLNIYQKYISSRFVQTDNTRNDIKPNWYRLNQTLLKTLPKLTHITDDYFCSDI